MTSQVSHSGGAIAKKSSTPTIVLLTPHEAAKLLKVSTSWLAKARMRGDGPPYIKFGKPVRYTEAALQAWLKSHQR
jgi:predicted DNA-binding transcriptional regulator AlpA